MRNENLTITYHSICSIKRLHKINKDNKKTNK